MYEVLVKKKVLKDIGKLPEPIQKALVNLIDDLREKGPIRNEWPNFGKIGTFDAICRENGWPVGIAKRNL